MPTLRRFVTVAHLTKAILGAALLGLAPHSSAQTPAPGPDPAAWPSPSVCAAWEPGGYMPQMERERFWEGSPAASRYVPGVWLHPGTHRSTVFDLRGSTGLATAGEDHATYLAPHPDVVPSSVQKGSTQ